jgi:hypothetical protein
MPPDNRQLFIRDIIDSQLESADHLALGRVADVEMEMREDGRLVLTALLTGPQALAGRVSHVLRHIFAFFLRDRFECSLPLSEVATFGPTLHLHRNADEYPVGRSERWIAHYILRWIPGSKR